ncbi:MAG: hypothetical protein WCZ90_02225 [Melioribacteraceae bacterium]
MKKNKTRIENNITEENKKSVKYWLSRPVEERFAEMERFRNEYFDVHPELPRRLVMVGRTINGITGEVIRTTGNPNKTRK